MDIPRPENFNETYLYEGGVAPPPPPLITRHNAEPFPSRIDGV